MAAKESKKGADQTSGELQIIQAICQCITDSGKDVSKVTYDNDVRAYSVVSIYGLKYIRVKWGKKIKFITIPDHMNYVLKLFQLPETATISDGWIRIPISGEIDIIALSKLLCEIYDYCYTKAAGESFGCCSRYLECSDNKACIQESEQWSKGCAYRQNLINGKIFYGANSTIRH